MRLGALLVLTAPFLLGACRGSLQGGGSDTETGGSSASGPGSSGSAGTATAGSGTGATEGTQGSAGTTAGSGTAGTASGTSGSGTSGASASSGGVVPGCSNGVFEPGELCWPSAQTVNAGALPAELVVTSLDGNARDDLAWMSGGTVLVFLGRADGTFQSKTPANLGVTGTNGRLRFADLNDQGDLDLVASSPLEQKLSVADGLGDGTFGNFAVLNPDVGGNAVTVGDFAVANYNATDAWPEIYTFWGDEAWGLPTGMTLAMCPFCLWFTWTGTGATSSGPYNPIVGDFNGDGIPDRGEFWASPVPSAGFWAGVGDGTFTGGRSEGFPGMQSPARNVVADVNVDGADDIVAMYAGKLWVLPGIPGGMAAPPVAETITTYNMTDVAFWDLDTDGDSDAVACTTDGGFLVLWNDGTGTLTEAPALVDGTPCDRLVIGDFDGDALPDLAIRGVGGGVSAYHFDP